MLKYVVISAPGTPDKRDMNSVCGQAWQQAFFAGLTVCGRMGCCYHG